MITEVHATLASVASALLAIMWLIAEKRITRLTRNGHKADEWWLGNVEQVAAQWQAEINAHGAAASLLIEVMDDVSDDQRKRILEHLRNEALCVDRLLTWRDEMHRRIDERARDLSGLPASREGDRGARRG